MNEYTRDTLNFFPNSPFLNINQQLSTTLSSSLSNISPTNTQKISISEHNHSHGGFCPAGHPYFRRRRSSSVSCSSLKSKNKINTKIEAHGSMLLNDIKKLPLHEKSKILNVINRDRNLRNKDVDRLFQIGRVQKALSQVSLEEKNDKEVNESSDNSRPVSILKRHTQSAMARSSQIVLSAPNFTAKSPEKSITPFFKKITSQLQIYRDSNLREKIDKNDDVTREEYLSKLRRVSLADNWFQQEREKTIEKKRDDKSTIFDTSPYKVPSIYAESEEEAISFSGTVR